MQSIFKLFIFLFLLLSSVAKADSLRVVVSIKPIYSIVSSIMKGIGSPTLLVKGISSPHDYNLRTSDARILENSDIIFGLVRKWNIFWRSHCNL
nr:zinc ABC transporter substrate-binding protein [Candidatus Liberibacter africanus]